LKNVKNLKKSVITAQAGIQKPLILLTTSHWTPAFAGVTVFFYTLLKADLQSRINAAGSKSTTAP
jgi:hypothetical protein